MRPFDAFALPAEPWKNGGGVTRTVAVSPEGAGFEDFEWRVSIAEVRAPGPFSRFPGIDRTILLLEGAGMVLRAADAPAAVLAEPFRPHSFRGDDAVSCELSGGAVRDFNVMTRRGRAHAEVRVWRSEFAVPDGADAALLYCARGRCRFEGGGLAAGWALRIDSGGEGMRFAPAGPDAVTIGVLVKRDRDKGAEQ